MKNRFRKWNYQTQSSASPCIFKKINAKNGNVSRKLEIIKIRQMEIIEPKNIIKC